MTIEVPLTTTTTKGLHPGLTRRQISMMGLGGAIGAGLFVGSGQAIGIAGPAVIVSYLVAGTIVVLVMAMLAEMVAANRRPAHSARTRRRPWAAASEARWAGCTGSSSSS